MEVREDGSGVRVLVVDDDPGMRAAVRETLVREGYAVATAGDGREALRVLGDGPVGLVVTDVKMPKVGGMALLAEVKKNWPALPVVVMTGYGTIDNAVEAMKRGAVDYLVKPFAPDVLVEAVHRNADAGIPDDPDDLCRIPGGTGEKTAIVTRDAAMLALLRTARNIAPSDATVLIRGESGTGKEMVAFFIHKHSRRASRPFVAVNCAALPENLLESELFGHEKGAFTGALAAKKGKFELADGGTILLDEISEMDARLQVKLLRVLQEREIDRVGGGSPVPVDLRVLATTNRDLEKEVEAGRFREDLYYRLHVIPLTLPPLRDRRGDVEALAESFLRRFAEKNGKRALRFSDEAREKLLRHAWPGNVRELQNTIERGVLLTPGDAVDAAHLLLCGKETDGARPLATPVGTSLRDMERQLVLDTLGDCAGNRTQAAKVLGISIRTLRNKLHEYREEGSFEDNAR
jgi:two-component system response regulator FlrC